MSSTTFANTMTSFLSLDIEAPFNHLLPIECEQRQGISNAGNIKIICAIPDHHLEDISAQQQKLLSQQVGLTICAAVNTDPHYFQGVVTAIDINLKKKQCTLKLETALGLLKQSKRNRIFLGKKPFDIVQQIFQEQLQKPYPTFKIDAPIGLINGLALNAEKPMVMQYQESDYAFISRLLHSIGVYYYFSFNQKACTIHFVNDPSYLQSISLDEQAISHWKKIDRQFANNFILDTYHATEANTDFSIGKMNNKMNNIYEFPGDYQTHKAGQALAKQKQSVQQAANNYYKGTTGCLNFLPGMCFTQLDDHGQEKEYVITQVDIKVKRHAHFTGSSGNQQNTYICKFVAVEAELPYQPACPFKKPVIHSVQTAKVITPDSQPVYTNQLGQTKVQFMWDDSKHAAEQAAWVRVMQGSAGKHWGMLWMPRVGNEVLVSFENGDIDKPIIVGSAYNKTNLPPLQIEKQSSNKASAASYAVSITMASMNHDATDSARTNSLILYNKMYQESITLNAQRDFIQNININANTTVQGESKTQVRNGNMFIEVENGSLLVKASEHMTLKVGSSQLIISPMNMSLVSPLVQLNPTSPSSPKPNDLLNAANAASKSAKKSYPMIQNSKAAN